VQVAEFSTDPGPASTDPGWQPVSNETAANGCITATFDHDTTPSIDELTGSWFRGGSPGAASARGATGATSTGSYFDLRQGPGSAFGSITMTDCSLNGATSIQWFHPATLSLVAGWNAIDLPVQTSLSSLVGLATNIDGQTGASTVAAVTAYRNGRYQIALPGYAADVTFGPSDGILVLASAPASWHLSGPSYAAAQPITLVRGWNLVAAPFPLGGLMASTVGSEAKGCASVGGADVRAVATLSGGSYHTWVPGTTSQNLAIANTQGFWIECDTAGSLTPS
jgi:hypothetical protein